MLNIRCIFVLFMHPNCSIDSKTINVFAYKKNYQGEISKVLAFVVLYYSLFSSVMKLTYILCSHFSIKRLWFGLAISGQNEGAFRPKSHFELPQRKKFGQGRARPRAAKFCSKSDRTKMISSSFMKKMFKVLGVGYTKNKKAQRVTCKRCYDTKKKA